MKKTSLPPIFLMLSILIILLIPSIPYVHAPFKNSAKVDLCTVNPCTSSALPISTSDLIMVHALCDNSAANFGSVQDSLGNSYTTDVSVVWSQRDAVFHSFSSFAGSDTITVGLGTCNSGISFSVETYSGITSIGNINSKIPSGTNCLAGCADTITLTTQATSIVYEAMDITGANSVCPTFAQNSGQNLRETFTCFVFGGNTRITGISLDKQMTTAGLNSFIDTWTTANGFTESGGHIVVELRTTTVSTTLVTQCYGNCGNPPVTLVNANATHGVTFNQSYTLFYEFQSNLNGVLQNVTTNVAKSYGNGQQVALGVYTASCSPGTTPFTIGCAGTLQGSSISYSNIQKGKLTLNTQVSVVTGQWVAIAVTGIFSGLDLNQTNVSCNDPSQFCVNGIQYTKGTIPSIISSSSTCSASGSPCNFGSISSTGLWAYVTGNVIISAPIPTPSAGCQNVDLACYLVASACGLTPSNCFIGGTIYLFIYNVVFVIGVTLCFSYINREYETEVHFPPALFFLFFILSLFMFSAMGLIPTYVPIVIFLLTALGVAGYFGSSFMGRGKSE